MQDAIVFDKAMNPAPVNGVYTFIQNLQALKIPVGLVTSSHNTRALLMLEKQNLHPFFHTYVTAEDVTKGKPHPEPYLAMANKLNVSPEYCLVFEDAISGVQSAKAAGMEVIGINVAEASENLVVNGAACVVSGFNELTLKQQILQASDQVAYQLQAF